LAEKKFFDFGLATARRLTRLRPQQLANDPVLPTIAWLKKISRLRQRRLSIRKTGFDLVSSSP
jgi:hypothetical protein